MTRKGQVTGLAPCLAVSMPGAWHLLPDSLLRGCTFSGDLVAHTALTSPALPRRIQMNQPRPLPFQVTWPGSGRSRGAYYSYSVWQLQGRVTACWGFSLGLSRVLSDLGLPPELRSPLHSSWVMSLSTWHHPNVSWVPRRRLKWSAKLSALLLHRAELTHPASSPTTP